MVYIGVIVLAILIVYTFVVIDLVLLYNKRRKELERIRKETTEDILNKVGMEIHDNWGQILSATSLMLSQTNLNANESIEIRETARMQISEVIDGIRKIKSSFSDLKLQHNDLFIQLEQLKIMNENTGIVKVCLQTEGDSKKLGDDVSLILYRITQELMNNSLRHGQAGECLINLLIDAKKAYYRYTDNGRGFLIKPETEWEGNGLSNICHRFRMINAKFNMHSSPGQGFSLDAEIQFNS